VTVDGNEEFVFDEMGMTATSDPFFAGYKVGTFGSEGEIFVEFNGNGFANLFGKVREID